MRKTLFVLGCAAIVAFTGCTGESNRAKATGTANFRAINAIPTSPTFSVLIEERLIGTADYKDASSPSSFDDLDYVFNFEVILAGDLTRSRVASTAVATERDKAYTFLLSGDIAAPAVNVWEYDRREWEGTETVFQGRFAHTAESLGPIDVYFQPTGTPPALGMEAGTLSFSEILPTVDYPEGEYEVILTTAGDPGDVLFTSSPLTPVVQAGFILAVFDADANDLDPISVRILNDSGGVSAVPDVNSTPTIRFYHASSNLETSDVYSDEMLMDQILADHAYRDVTGDMPIDSGTYPLTYTAVGNTGAILHENTASIFSGSRSHFYVVGEMDALTSFQRIPDRRSVETLVKFSFLHAATNHDFVDLYVVEAGEVIDDLVPRIFNAAIGTPPVTVNLQEGDFELYLTTSGEKTVLAGPIPFSPVLGDVVEYISYDNVDPAIADLVAIPLP